MIGHLRLVCGRGGNGDSQLQEQSFSAPMHISKPFQSGDALVVNIVNPTAGMFSGDRVDVSVQVRENGALSLTTPSASRIYTSLNGPSRLSQHFSVTGESLLESFPEYLIPQRDCEYCQATRLDVEAGSHAILFEILAPGRVAHGEAFAYRRLEFAQDVFYGGDLVSRERYHLSPLDESLRLMRRISATPYYASILALGPAFGGKLPFELPAGCHVGQSRLGSAGWAFRVIAPESVVLRKAIHQLRASLYERLGKPVPGLRRAGFPSI